MIVISFYTTDQLRQNFSSMAGLNLLLLESTNEFVKCCEKVGDRGKQRNGGIPYEYTMIT